MLKEDLSVEFEAVLNFLDGARSAGEADGDVEARLEVTRVVGELATTDVVGFGDLCAFSLEISSYGADEFFDVSLSTFGVEND